MLCWAGAAVADMGGSFQEGKELGGSVAEGAFAGINSGAAEENVPAYGANPAEIQYYQGGQGQLSDPGVAKLQSCASYAPGSDKIANQECEAVNFLARNPDIRPQFNITRNDPMVLGAKAARNNAESFFQSLGISGGTGGSTQCATNTETTPAQYTTETCSMLREAGTQQCTMGRVVNIDADASFQCDSTVSAYETLTCSKIVTADVVQTVTQEWVTREWNPPRGPWGKPLSTYDDLRHGPQSVCNVVWPGSTVVSASCAGPPPLQTIGTSPSVLCYASESNWTCFRYAGEGYEFLGSYTYCEQSGGGELAPTTYSCRPPDGGCDYLHNGGWYTAWYCPDQGWCSGYGIAYVSCKKLEDRISYTVTPRTINNCATLEQRAQ